MTFARHALVAAAALVVAGACAGDDDSASTETLARPSMTAVAGPIDYVDAPSLATIRADPRLRPRDVENLADFELAADPSSGGEGRSLYKAMVARSSPADPEIFEVDGGRVDGLVLTAGWGAEQTVHLLCAINRRQVPCSPSDAVPTIRLGNETAALTPYSLAVEPGDEVGVYVSADDGRHPIPSSSYLRGYAQARPQTTSAEAVADSADVLGGCDIIGVVDESGKPFVAAIEFCESGRHLVDAVLIVDRLRIVPLSPFRLTPLLIDHSFSVDLEPELSKDDCLVQAFAHNLTGDPERYFLSRAINRCR